jgi:pimeloyl-ACP methyl ester carboxylesterase
MASGAAFTVKTDDGVELCARLDQHPQPQRPGILVLCHGLLNNADSHVVRSLAAALPLHTCRFDFRGNGQSYGETSYGNYEDEARDLDAVVRHLRQHYAHLGPVLGAFGHSKAASVVLIHAAQYDTGSEWFVGCLSGRFSMREAPKDRFSASQLADLERTGKFVWRQYAVNNNEERRDYVVTKEALDRRSALDMAAVCRQVATKRDSVRVLLIHGDADEVIPPQDLASYCDVFNAGNMAIDAHLAPGLSHFYNRADDIQLAARLAINILK